MLAEQSGIAANELASHLYVHYDDAAVDHAFRVAAGLDSMVVGEAQILGQLRDAYHAATEADTAGRLLHELMQQALRVGKRAHAETGIDRAGQSVVTAALDVGRRSPAASPGAPALVIGAGAMGALSVATLTRRRASGRCRSPTAAPTGPTGSPRRTARPPSRSPTSTAALAEADVVVSATASTEPCSPPSGRRRPGGATAGQPLVVLDLAVPRDVAPGRRRPARRHR